MIHSESRCDSRCELVGSRRQRREWETGDNVIQLPVPAAQDSRRTACCRSRSAQPRAQPTFQARDAVKASRRCIWLLAVHGLIEHLAGVR